MTLQLVAVKINAELLDVQRHGNAFRRAQSQPVRLCPCVGGGLRLYHRAVTRCSVSPPREVNNSFASESVKKHERRQSVLDICIEMF